MMDGIAYVLQYIQFSKKKNQVLWVQGLYLYAHHYHFTLLCLSSETHNLYRTKNK